MSHLVSLFLTAPPAYADALKYASSLQPSNSTGFATLEEGPPPYSTLDR